MALPMSPGDMTATTSFPPSAMAGCQRGQLCSIRGCVVPAPNDVQIGTYEQQIVAVGFAHGCIRNVEHVERRAAIAKRLLERRRCGLRAAEPQERIPFAETI